MFVTNWYDPNTWCSKNEARLTTCADNHSNVDVSVYQGEIQQKSCGTLQLTNGLEQSDQIYTLLCMAEGDTVKLSKNSGVIEVCELVVVASGKFPLNEVKVCRKIQGEKVDRNLETQVQYCYPQPLHGNRAGRENFRKLSREKVGKNYKIWSY